MRSFLTVTVAGLLASHPALAGNDDALVADAQATLQTFKSNGKIDKFLSSASGYAVFPTIAKGGLIVGGAGGDGVLFVGGKAVGIADRTLRPQGWRSRPVHPLMRTTPVASRCSR